MVSRAGPASSSFRLQATRLNLFSSNCITALPALFTLSGLRNLLDAPYGGGVERWPLRNYKFVITI